MLAIQIMTVTEVLSIWKQTFQKQKIEVYGKHKIHTQKL